MKLLSLQISPRGEHGLGSGRLDFADEVTQLFGPNGSGKTPVVQSIVYCLGYPVKFRADIFARCEKATLEVAIDGARYAMTRVYSANMLDVEVLEPSGTRQQFFNERDYSAYLFELLDLPFPNLVSSSNVATKPYMATLLPFFYLDQDDGYGSFYAPPSAFIKDQHAEMLRLVARLPCRNSFDSKKDLLAAKRELDRLDQMVLERRREADSSTTTGDTGSLQDVTDTLMQLRTEMDRLQQTGVTNTAAVAALERLIGERRRNLRELEAEVAEIDKRSSNTAQIASEIEAEVATLNLNEEAKRVFASFNEICRVEGCGLFAFSTESYAKNLLYLRDQIKDLDRISAHNAVRKESFLQQQNQVRLHITDLEAQRDTSANSSIAQATRSALDALTSQVLDLEMRKRDIGRNELLRTRLAEVIEQREKAIDQVQALTRDAEMTPGVVKLRVAIKDALLKWMDILQTSNVSDDIRFKDDFVPMFGPESLAQLKGSTKVRVVLAYHAAVIQAVTELIGDTPLQFLILDTPKQHEIHDIDLGRYIDELKRFGHERGLQIVFSATGYRHVGDSHDTEWTPMFSGERHEMFLGSPVAAPGS
ncbi:DNA repair exonuclease SbcCD ATPase subunit [Paraburkholderia terricola]|uniref:hypothetical protein n=1 Tax=Paraburkholderia terricola TaxID=169427 RepID=UPI0028620430|nr:hypothetical protein [Paraburkholderia terricola]MDR6495654.1 DNA repair exonuclease SbcCD ATPase subunit [Paraburkholderia terricola]